MYVWILFVSRNSMCEYVWILYICVYVFMNTICLYVWILSNMHVGKLSICM